MSTKIRRVDYFYATVQDRPGEAYQMLNELADRGINLVAFTAVPVGPESTQLTIFPEDSRNLTAEAERTGLELIGPHHAILVQGDDEIGALADVHKTLYTANVNVYASNGVSSGGGRFGYILYIRPEAYERAAKALNI